MTSVLLWFLLSNTYTINNACVEYLRISHSDCSTLCIFRFVLSLSAIIHKMPSSKGKPTDPELREQLKEGKFSHAAPKDMNTKC
ncbi:hypothetical protein F4860DRAFT_495391 [Xylaria cubensis]|nr:hypothetical protein F4860DRAFT_495391 [Xylaria cubensis]